MRAPHIKVVTCTQALDYFVETDRNPSELHKSYSLGTGPLRKVSNDIKEQLEALGRVSEN